jgi:hypothetical protein
VGNVTADIDPIWETLPGNDNCVINAVAQPSETPIRAPVNAPAGVQSVVMQWSGGNFTGSKNMVLSGGVYISILGKFYTDNPGVPQGGTVTLTVTVTVTDTLNRQATGQVSVALKDCPG